LPSRSVRIGDSWTATANAFARLYEIGDCIRFVDSDGGELPHFVERSLLEALHGTILVRFERLEWQGSDAIAVLTLRSALKGTIEPLEREGVLYLLGYAVSAKLETQSSVEFDVEGTVEWNLSRRSARRARLTADVRADNRVGGEWDDDVAVTATDQRHWSGKLQLSVETLP
jgi:hypothetical protein